MSAHCPPTTVHDSSLSGRISKRGVAQVQEPMEVLTWNVAYIDSVEAVDKFSHWGLEAGIGAAALPSSGCARQ
jgi:hypothetical protein